MAATIGAGDMDVPVNFYKNEFVIDADGAASVSSALYLSTYCHVKYIGTPSAGASEELLNDQKTGKVKVQITLRFATGVDFDDTFSMEGGNFNIYSIHIIGRREFLVIRGESRDDQSDVPGKYKAKFPFGDLLSPITISAPETPVTLTIKDYEQMAVNYSTDPLISSAALYSDNSLIGTVTLAGTTKSVGGVVQGYKIIPGTGETALTASFSSIEIGVRNFVRFTVKIWDGAAYQSYQYEQDVTISQAKGWQDDLFPLAGPVDVKTSSSIEDNKVRANDHQDWRLTIKDPSLYSNVKYGLKYRRVGTTITKGAESITNDAGTAWGDYVPVIKIKDTEPTTYTVMFEAYINSPADAKQFTCEIQNG